MQSAHLRYLPAAATDVEKLLADRRRVACRARAGRSLYTNTRIYVSDLYKYCRLFDKYDAALGRCASCIDGDAGQHMTYIL